MYQALGSNIGNVHPPLSQGVGLATVLTNGTTDQYLNRYTELMAAERKRKLEERAAERNAALKKMQDINPDFFYAHNKEISAAHEDAMRLGVQALKSGVNDPWTATDGQSVAFQKAMAKLQEMSHVSTQIKDQYKAWQQDVQAKGADYFDPKTIAENNKFFFGASLQDHMQNPTATPLLTQRQPLQNSIEFASGIAGKLSNGKDGTPVDVAKVNDVIRAAFRDPETGAKTMETFSRALAGYSDSERKQVEAAGLQYGLSAPEMLAVQYTQKFLASPKPYSVQDALHQGDSALTVSYTEGGDTNQSYRVPNKKTTMAAATSIARGILHDDPRALSSFANMYGLKHDPNESEEEYFTEVQRALATDLYNREAKNREYRKTERGQDRKELEVSTDRWLSDLKSGKMELAQEAANVLQNSKYYGNLYIASARVAPSLQDVWDEAWVGKPFGNNAAAAGQSAGAMVLDIKTPMSAKPIKDDDVYDMMGEKKDSGKIDVQQTQGGFKVVINLDKLEPNDQLLRTIYQKAHKETGTLYQGPGYVPNQPETAADILKPVVPQYKY